MSEAEVSSRLALHIIKNALNNGDVHIAIDGAQIKNKETVIFDMMKFMSQQGCTASQEDWKNCRFTVPGYDSGICIHSKGGVGDVVVKLKDNKTLYIESKKGSIMNSSNSAEYKLLREAIGQIMTIPTIDDSYIYAVALPESDKSVALAERWREAPLIKKVGIHILLVSYEGVSGLELIKRDYLEVTNARNYNSI